MPSKAVVNAGAVVAFRIHNGWMNPGYNRSVNQSQSRPAVFNLNSDFPKIEFKCITIA